MLRLVATMQFIESVYNWSGDLKSIFISNVGGLGPAILLLYSWGTELQYIKKWFNYMTPS